MPSRFTAARWNTLFGRTAERFLPYALEGIRGASGVLVGSRHTAESLWEVLSDEPSLPDGRGWARPGVDVNSFRPRRKQEAAIGLSRLADKLAAGETAAGEARLAPRRHSGNSIRAVIGL